MDIRSRVNRKTCAVFSFVDGQAEVEHNTALCDKMGLTGHARDIDLIQNDGDCLVKFHGSI